MSARVRAAAGALVVMLAAPFAPARAAPASEPPGSVSTSDYHIVTQRGKYSLESGDFTMPEKVHLTRPGTDAVADSAHGNTKRGLATLIGHVVVHDSGNAPETASVTAYKGSGPATLVCDQLDVDARAKLYTATGNVHFIQGSSSGTADRAVLNRTTGSLHLEGNVHLSQNGSSMSASSVDYNLNTKDAEFSGNPVQMSEPVGSGGAQPPSPKARPAPKPRPTKTPARKP